MKPGPIAITGAGGFLGRVLATEIAKVHPVRLADVGPTPDCGEQLRGDVGDPVFACKLLTGAGALVISHMLPRSPGAYDQPKGPFDVNVTATATLFDEAVRQGCGCVILISSIMVVSGHFGTGKFLERSLAPAPTDIYGLTKTLQEEIAAFYHRKNGLPVAMLRPAYVTDEDSMTDKYGRQKSSVNWQFIDCRDIATAVLAALHLPDLGLETFYLLGHADGERRADIAHTKARLGWEPMHTFSAFPVDNV